MHLSKDKTRGEEAIVGTHEKCFVNIWPWRPSTQIIMQGYEPKWHQSWKYNSHLWINQNSLRKFTTQRKIRRHKHHRFKKQVETSHNGWQLPHFILECLERNTIDLNHIKFSSHLKKKKQNSRILLCTRYSNYSGYLVCAFHISDEMIFRYLTIQVSRSIPKCRFQQWNVNIIPKS